MKKVILGLVLVSVLSGCAHRAPASKVTKAAEPNLNDTVVQICDFAFTLTTRVTQVSP